MDRFNKEYIPSKGSRIVVINNEIKDVMKVIKYLENRASLLKVSAGKIISQEGRFLIFLGPLMTAGLPIMKSVLTTLAKNLLIPLRLTTAALTTGAAIHKKIYGSGSTALIISNKEINDIMKIVKSLEELGFLIKGVSETSKNQANVKKPISRKVIRYISCKYVEEYISRKKPKIPGRGKIRAGEVTIRAGKGTSREGQNFKITSSFN